MDDTISVGRWRSKINHRWVNFFPMQNLTCICSDKMIPMTQGSLPSSFKAIRVGRAAINYVDPYPSKINESWETSQEVSSQSDFPAAKYSTDDDVDQRRSPSLKNKSPMGQLSSYAKSHWQFSNEMIPMTQRSLPRSFKDIRVGRPAVDHVDRRPSKINESWSMTQGNLRKSFKAIRPARDQIFDGRRGGSPSVGSLPRSFKAIRVGRPAVDHVDRRPSKINESWVNFFSMQNLTCICWVKMKPMTQGNLLRSFKAIRFARGQLFDGRRRGWLSDDKMIPMSQVSLLRSFMAIRVGRPAVDHVDRRPSKINESWVNFFSMQNLTCICWVKMKPMTQGNLLRSFKAIRFARGQLFDGRRRGWLSDGDVQKSITHGDDDVDRRWSAPLKNQSPMGQPFFYAKSHVHMLSQNDTYDTRKPRKKFKGDPSRSPGSRPRGSPSIKIH
ncbi:uncharacterized protein G2W53_027122 [Senna tora]|uniref:Uncharacterized protein n=1 Tax=Senna tora TaxID=362788 RepID=A0A834TGD1_9FABA|nr:uncharacterized protein G2W53_027122 [Senna tora]